LQHSQTLIAEEESTIELNASEAISLGIDEIIGRFLDTTYSYRFGPPKHDVVVVSVIEQSGESSHVAAFFPGSQNLRQIDEMPLSTKLHHDGDVTEVTLLSESFLQCVELVSRTHTFSDNYFHLAPNTPYRLMAHAREPGKSFRGSLSALNASSTLLVQ
jgi:beta-mannosidase